LRFDEVQKLGFWSTPLNVYQSPSTIGITVMNRNREPAHNHHNDRIELDDNRTYTAEEVAEKVKQVVDFIGKQAEDNPLRYSYWDVYYLLHDLLRYVNRNMEGKFFLKRLKKGSWRVDYLTEADARRKDREKHKRELRQTADLLEELTDRRPPWG
jgi:hypothetical protein